MHLKAKRAAFGGLLLAMTVIFMFLGSVIETNTLFLLAAASFFVGVVFREFGQMTGLAFYLSAVLLGFLLAPNKLYVITFAGMGFYIWGREFIWKILERSAGVKRKMQWYRLAKVILFNGLYLPLILGYGELFFPLSHRNVALPFCPFLLRKKPVSYLSPDLQLYIVICLIIKCKNHLSCQNRTVTKPLRYFSSEK